MTLERMQIAIGKLLLIGVMASLVVVLLGGILYLANHGNDYVNYQMFHGEPKQFTTVASILSHVFTFSSLDLIQTGLLTLVIVQVLRVALTAWLFIQAKDKLFFLISLFILFVLVYGLI